MKHTLISSFLTLLLVFFLPQGTDMRTLNNKQGQTLG